MPQPYPKLGTLPILIFFRPSQESYCCQQRDNPGYFLIRQSSFTAHDRHYADVDAAPWHTRRVYAGRIRGTARPIYLITR